MMALVEKKRPTRQLRAYLRDCQQFFDPLFKVQLDFLEATFGMDDDSILQWPIFRGLSSKERWKILKKRRQLTKYPHFSRWISLFKEALNLKKTLKTRKKIFTRGQEILEEISLLKSPFWRHWIELAVSFNTTNSAWGHQAVSRILRTGPYEMFFYAPLNFKREMESEMSELFYQAIQRFKKKIKNEMLVRMLEDTVAQLGHDTENKALRGRFYTNWSLSELREISSKGLLTKKYFDFWYSKYLNRTSELEMKTFLRKILTPQTLKKAIPSQLWVFAHHLPGDQKLRQILLEKLMKAWRSENIYHQFVVVELAGQEPLRRALSKQIPEFQKAYFQIERNYYQRLLNSGGAIHLALYHLIRLGDRNPENLWWMAL